MAGDASVLLVSTRGIKARYRHLQRDLLRLLPHSKAGAKVSTEDGLDGVRQLCEEGECGAALLLDTRDPRRLYMWAASCPDGPSAMFRVVNVHTVAELKLEARRAHANKTPHAPDRMHTPSTHARCLRPPPRPPCVGSDARAPSAHADLLPHTGTSRDGRAQPPRLRPVLPNDF